MNFPYDRSFKLDPVMTDRRTTPPSPGAEPAPTRRKKRQAASFELAPLKPEDADDTTQNRAYRALKAAVLGGAFYPGTTVTLAKLSEMLGTSEMPVREALKRLTAEGAFEAAPNRSARIPVLSPLVVRQLLDLRVDLESKAAALAAEHVSKRHLDQLTALDAAMAKALDQHELPQYVALNMEFHFLIYRLADNEPLLSLIEALWLRMAPVVAATLALQRNADAQFDEAGRAHHGNIIKAFLAQNAAAAAEEIRADLLHPGNFIHYFDDSAPGGTKSAG